MTRFIRLTNLIVNTSKIVTVDILPTKYVMNMDNHHFHGWILFSSGNIESRPNTVEICETKHPKDYEIVKKWIDSIKHGDFNAASLRDAELKSRLVSKDSFAVLGTNE